MIEIDAPRDFLNSCATAHPVVSGIEISSRMASGRILVAAASAEPPSDAEPSSKSQRQQHIAQQLNMRRIIVGYEDLLPLALIAAYGRVLRYARAGGVDAR